MKMPNITECRECGSAALTWDTHNKNISQAQHGRLTTQDIRCQFVLGCDHCSETLAVVSADQVAAWLTESREASAEPSAPKCKGWTCFHCDEHFTDSEAAAIHFGAHENQRPACLIDAAEYRSMEARVRECANEDSELHRQMHRQSNEHKLDLRRAEESGYVKGLADARAPVERDERAEFEACIRREWPMAPISRKRDLLPKDDPCYGDYCDEPLQRAWVGWQMRAALERKPSTAGVRMYSTPL